MVVHVKYILKAATFVSKQSHSQQNHKKGHNEPKSCQQLHKPAIPFKYDKRWKAIARVDWRDTKASKHASQNKPQK